MARDFTGKRMQMGNGMFLEIIEYKGPHDATVRFDDGHVVEKVSYSNLLGGKVRNPYIPNIYGFGYLGIGKHKCNVDQKPCVKYVVWQAMIRRVMDKKLHGRNPTYAETAVFKGWADFQVFGDWFEENYVEGWELDKDILVKGNKAYHPLRCCFVPKEINNFFCKSDGARGVLPIGVMLNGKYYRGQLLDNNGKKIFGPLCATPEEAFLWYKEQKETKLKELAEKWKGFITDNVYIALINYTVEITD
jgi:hypothetical protein